MDQTSWYRRFFRRVRTLDSNATRVKADQGNAEAQFALGLRYGTAEGELQDLEQAANGTPKRPSKIIPWRSSTLD
jgi:TPR repeat protein